MSQALTRTEPQPQALQAPDAQRARQADALEKLVVDGDLSRLSAEQRISYYYMRCEAAGINPEAQPFEYLNLQGKLVLYARKACSDQLIAKRKLTVQVVSRVVVDDMCEVTAKVTRPDGSSVEDVGVVPLGNARGEQRAHAIMKCVTKAKRRAVLSACGLGMLDDTEVDAVQGARRVSLEAAHEDQAGAVRRWCDNFGRCARLTELLVLEKQALAELNPDGLPEALRTQVRTAIQQARQRLGRRAKVETAPPLVIEDEEPEQPSTPSQKDEAEQLRTDLAAAATRGQAEQAYATFEKSLADWKDQKAAAAMRDAGKSLTQKRIAELAPVRGGDEP